MSVEDLFSREEVEKKGAKDEAKEKAKPTSVREWAIVFCMRHACDCTCGVCVCVCMCVFVCVHVCVHVHVYV